MPAPYVWRGLAHIASYLAEPLHPAAFEPVARMHKAQPAPAMLEAWLHMTLRKPASVRGKSVCSAFTPLPGFARRLVVCFTKSNKG